MAELYYYGQASKGVYQLRKIHSVFRCIMKALGELKEDSAEAALFGKRRYGGKKRRYRHLRKLYQ